MLGEEVTSQGTARYVDSSVERLQVTVTRHDRRPPRRRLQRPARAAAHRPARAASSSPACATAPGSRRRRCIRPSACTRRWCFDVVDTWNGRSIGGCTYHVAHPGGRNYETFPVNANEAEARRVARFWPHGHTPGPMPPPPEERNPEFPYTLDLRYRESC